jgi:hypothetical protein
MSRQGTKEDLSEVDNAPAQNTTINHGDGKESWPGNRGLPLEYSSPHGRTSLARLYNPRQCRCL